MARPPPSQDSWTLSLFEVVSAYFCDTLYNHLYNSARAGVAPGSSVTDEYSRRALAYVNGVKSDKQCYGEVVQGVHKYFTSMTRYATLGFSRFVDQIVQVCVPDEYFGQLTSGEKDEILSSVLCDLVANLAAFATTHDMLRRIIDGHDREPAVTIRMLQDAAVGALIAKRAAVRNQFLRKAGQARDHVSLDVAEDMKRALRQLVKEKAEAVARANKLEAALADQQREAKTREAKFLKLIGLLRAGQAEGPAVAGGRLRMPARDTLAEADDPLDYPSVPRRETVAEAAGRRGEPAPRGDPPRQRGGAPAPPRAGPATPPAPRGGAAPVRVTSDFFASPTAPAAGPLSALAVPTAAPSAPARGGPSAKPPPQQPPQLPFSFAPPAAPPAARPADTRPITAQLLSGDDDFIDQLLGGDADGAGGGWGDGADGAGSWGGEGDS
jgi:hypothetical protein